MKKVWLCLTVPFLTALLQAQETSADALSEQEASAVAAILAKTAAQAEKPAEPEEKIILPEETKQEAFKEANPPQQPAAKPEDKTPSAKPADGAPEETAAPAEAEEDGADQPKEVLKCLTVAYIDIDEAFNEHPRTIAVKEQIRLKILSKEEEVNGAKQLISVLEAENKRLGVT